MDIPIFTDEFVDFACIASLSSSWFATLGNEFASSGVAYVSECLDATEAEDGDRTEQAGFYGKAESLLYALSKRTMGMSL